MRRASVSGALGTYKEVRTKVRSHQTAVLSDSVKGLHPKQERRDKSKPSGVLIFCKDACYAGHRWQACNSLVSFAPRRPLLLLTITW